jgi:hypothetical protein
MFFYILVGVVLVLVAAVFVLRPTMTGKADKQIIHSGATK